jgi:protein transport protein SEC13
MIIIFRHDGPVWKVSWSHPRFGSLLASCGFDRRIIIWKESAHNKWDKLYEYNDHKNSVNVVTFAPHEYGLILLGGSSDGYISIHEYKNEVWSSVQFFGHGFGVSSLSWAPSANTISTESTLEISNNPSQLKFVSGGLDNLIRVWQTNDNQIKSFHVAATLDGHEDFIRDVAWRPNLNTNLDTIASGGDVIYLSNFI